MRIQIDSSAERTKLFKYMFGIEISIYNSIHIEKAFERLEPYYLNEPWDRINVYLDDEATTDYDLSEQLNSEEPLYMYHVKVDTRCSDFAQILDTLKTSPNYVDCYQCCDVDSHYAIIRFKVSVIRRISTLLDSKYSQLYKPEELTNIKKKQDIVRRYAKINANNEVLFNEAMQVLTKDENAFNAICEKFNITDEKTKSIMKNNEYDSKYNLSLETINSRTLCKSQ